MWYTYWGQVSDACDPDIDGDTVLNAVDNCLLIANLDQADLDGDGLGTLCDPDDTNPDFDGDGLADGTEDANRNGTVDAGETDPLTADTDADGLLDGTEDANANGVVDAGETDPLDPDTDADGLTDGDEVLTFGTDPLLSDTDGDGLTDGDEVFVSGTDPLDPDSDADTFSDGDELTIGSNPLDPASTPEDDTINPGSCGDGLDNDLDGLVDLDDTGCPVPPVSIQPAPTNPNQGGSEADSPPPDEPSPTSPKRDRRSKWW